MSSIFEFYTQLLTLPKIFLAVVRNRICIDYWMYFEYNQTMKYNLKSHSLISMRNTMTNMGIEPYRGDQIFKWIWQKNAKDFSIMTNISKELRESLLSKFTISGLQIKKKLLAKDGSKSTTC